MATRKPTPAGILDDLLSAPGVSRETGLRIVRMPLAQVADNPFQYRQHYGVEGIHDLAVNIASLCYQLPATSGLQQVPMARLCHRGAGGQLTPVDAVTYERQYAIDNLLRTGDVVAELAYGHRRLRAFSALATGPQAIDLKEDPGSWPAPDPAEFGTLPVQLMHLDDQAMAEFALTENSQREDVSAIEEATLLQRMIDELGIGIEDVGRKFGWSRSTTSNKLRLLKLPEKARQYVLTGDLSEKHARTLLRLADAPALLGDVAYDCKSQSWSTRTLDEKITGRIAELPGMPDGQDVVYQGRYGTSRYSQPWDYDWVPDGAPIVGACNGCPRRITFAGEPAPRCADQHCYKAKKQLWPLENHKRQRQAAQIALDNEHGGTALVDVLTDAGRRRVMVLERAATWNDKTITLFRYTGLNADALKLVVENQECGPECKCFAACYRERDSYQPQPTDGWRPDPVNAPDVYYACTDAECMGLKLAPLQSVAKQLDADRRAREHAEMMASNEDYRKRQEDRQREDEKRQLEAAENRRQVSDMIASATAAAGGIDALWANKAFLIETVIAGRGNWYQEERIRMELADKSVDAIRQALVWDVVAGHARHADQFDTSAVQSICNRIAPPPAQPAPGDSQATNWQADWDDGDENAYEDVMGQWTGSWSALQAVLGQVESTPRVLLRLIEVCPDKAVRGDLWRMHNSVAVAA